ncbi:hypothetical protein CRYUN_Cryun14cG0155400 [Craigia yunnanensis]
MGESRRIWGGFNFSILVVLIIMLLSIDQHFAADAITKNKNISNQCSSSNKECLQLLSNDVEMEFLMDSEASKRVFEASASTFSDSTHPTIRAVDASRPAFCDRGTGKSCAPDSNPSTKRPPNCSPDSFNRECHRFK